MGVFDWIKEKIGLDSDSGSSDSRDSYSGRTYPDDFVGPIREKDRRESDPKKSKPKPKQEKPKKSRKSSSRSSSRSSKSTQKEEPLKMTTEEGVVEVEREKTQREIQEELRRQISGDKYNKQREIRRRIKESQREMPTGEPSEYEIVNGEVKRKELIPDYPVISRDTGRRDKTQWQEEFLKSKTAIPKFGTLASGESPTKTLGKLQTERELDRFRTQQEYEEEIKSELDKDLENYTEKTVSAYQDAVNKGSISSQEANKLINEDLATYQQKLLESPKYKRMSKEFEKEYGKIKDVRGLSEAGFTGRTTAGYVLRSTPIVGSLIDVAERGKEYAKAEIDWNQIKKIAKKNPKDRTAKETLQYYSTIYQESGLLGDKTRSQKGLSFAGGVALASADISAIGGLAKAGATMSRKAIQKELAKRTSISLENMQKAKITGFNIIEKSTGKFVLRAKQRAGNFVKNIEVEGKLIKVGNDYAFIPEGKGTAVIKGLSEANLKGVSGKVKQKLSQITGQKSREGYVGYQEFDVSGAGVSRDVASGDISSFLSTQISPKGERTIQTLGKAGRRVDELLFSRQKGISSITTTREGAVTFPVDRKTTAKQISKTQRDIFGELGSTGRLQSSLVSGERTMVTPIDSVSITTPKLKGKVSRQVSRDSDIISSLYERPKAEVISTSKRLRRSSQTAGDALSDSLIHRRKPTPIPTPSKRSTRVELKKVKDKDLGMIEKSLQRIESPKIQFKPFSFTQRTGLSPLFLGSSIGAVATRTAQSRIKAPATTQELARVKAASRLSNQLVGSRQTAKQTSKTQTEAGITASPTIQNLTPFGGFGTGVRRVGFGKPRSKDKPMRAYKPTKKAKKRKKKGLFELEVTGLQAITGKRKPRKKKLSEVTGFEFLR